MDLLTLVIAILFVQIWGAQNPLHRDAWFHVLAQRLTALFSSRAVKVNSVAQDDGSDQVEVQGTLAVDDERVSDADPQIAEHVRDEIMPDENVKSEDAAQKNCQNQSSLLALLVTVFLPVLVALFFAWILVGISIWLLLPFNIILLLYSFGRGDFSQVVSEYTKACYVEDWSIAQARAEKLGVSVQTIMKNDWVTLHKRVFVEASYRGFERNFSVIFWFVLFGSIAAFMYRLVYLFVQAYPKNKWAEHVLWAIEWPVVRLVGLSFSLTGNFVGCFDILKAYFFNFTESSKSLLSHMVLGAFMVDDSIEQTTEVTRKELNLLSKLYIRTVWLWLTVIAALILFT